MTEELTMDGMRKLLPLWGTWIESKTKRHFQDDKNIPHSDKGMN
jgi:hypothetical protein